MNTNPSEAETPSTPEQLRQALIASLNKAVAADPMAMHALYTFRVPCNATLADHPHIVCQPLSNAENEVIGHQVGLLGVLNGFCEALGLPRIAARFRTDEAGHSYAIIGFTEYDPPTPAAE